MVDVYIMVILVRLTLFWSIFHLYSIALYNLNMEILALHALICEFYYVQLSWVEYVHSNYYAFYFWNNLKVFTDKNIPITYM